MEMDIWHERTFILTVEKKIPANWSFIEPSFIVRLHFRYFNVKHSQVDISTSWSKQSTIQQFSIELESWLSVPCLAPNQQVSVSAVAQEKIIMYLFSHGWRWKASHELLSALTFVTGLFVRIGYCLEIFLVKRNNVMVMPTFWMIVDMMMGWWCWWCCFTHADKILVSGPGCQPEQADGQQGGARQGVGASHCPWSQDGGQGSTKWQH